jgi:hypothetical protein
MDLDTAADLLDIEGTTPSTFAGSTRTTFSTGSSGLTNHDLSEKSQETYEARVRKAINMYIKFVDRDPSWKQVAGKGSRPKESTPAQSSTAPPRRSRRRPPSCRWRTPPRRACPSRTRTP